MPSDRAVYTVQQTSKRYKLAGLLGKLAIVAGVGAAFAGKEYGLLALSYAGLAVMAGGILLWAWAAAMKWWHHD